MFKAPRCAISLRLKIASERRFSLRLKGTKLIPTVEFPAIPESAVKIASERRCAILVHSAFYPFPLFFCHPFHSFPFSSPFPSPLCCSMIHPFFFHGLPCFFPFTCFVFLTLQFFFPSQTTDSLVPKGPSKHTQTCSLGEGWFKLKRSQHGGVCMCQYVGWFGCSGYLLVTVCGVTVYTVFCESNAASALNYSVGEPSNRFLETQSCTGC